MENIFLENLKTDKEKLNKVAEIFTRFRTGSQVVLLGFIFMSYIITGLLQKTLEKI